jgi:hypothetical protein
VVTANLIPTNQTPFDKCILIEIGKDHISSAWMSAGNSIHTLLTYVYAEEVVGNVKVPDIL